MNAAADDWRIYTTRSLAGRYAAHVNSWLHPCELDYWHSCGSESRRASWCWGRIAAKCLLVSQAELSHAAPREICIHSRSAAQLGMPPRVTYRDRELSCHISISHSTRRVAVAISSQAIGVDIVEDDDAQSPALANAWLGHEMSSGNRLTYDPVEAATYWAAKEAAFKTLPVGTPFQPRLIRLAAAQPRNFRWEVQSRGALLSGDVMLRRGVDFTFALARRFPHSGVSPATAT